MADNGKKKNKSSEKAKAKPSEEAKEKKVEREDVAEAKASAKVAHEEDEKAEDKHGDHDHAHAPVHGAQAGHGHAPNRKEYVVIFFVLFALTVLEVGVTKVPGVAKGLMAIALISLALTKAVIVALFFMHLKHETRVLKLTVAIPLATPAIYALVLISEAAWRLARW